MTASLRVMASCAIAALALATSAQAGESGAYHIFSTPAYQAETGRVPNLGATGSMEYFGGTVFSAVNVVSVIWGSNVNSQTVAGMPGFLSAIVNSTYVDQLSIYDTKHIRGVNGHKGSNQDIARGTFFGQVVITPHNNSTNLSDRDVQRELEYQIKIGVLPANDPNTLYMTYFPANVTITLDGLTSCSSFGAYHFSTSNKETPSNLFYGVMPDCGYSFGDHTIVSSHEFAEATTDNIPTPGTHPRFPQAWNTSNGYEIGDLCEGTQGNLTTKKTTYLVQEVYLNNIAGCGTGNFTSP